MKESRPTVAVNLIVTRDRVPRPNPAFYAKSQPTFKIFVKRKALELYLYSLVLLIEMRKKRIAVWQSSLYLVICFLFLSIGFP